MKKPWYFKKWEIFGQPIKIKILKRDQPFFFDGDRCLGIFEGDKKQVTLENCLTEKDMIETLYHEMGHAVINRLGLNQTSLTKDLEELIVDGFSKFIYDNFEPRKKPLKKS